MCSILFILTTFHNHDYVNWEINLYYHLSDPAAGASDDWYRGGLKTRYAFTTELRDTGYYGFQLPASQIIPSGEELFAGMKVVFEKLIADDMAGK